MYYWLYYILLLSLIIGTVSFDFLQRKKGYEQMFNILFFLLAIISTIRYGVGFDTLNYMVAFEAIPTIVDITYIDFLRFRFQPLYTLLNSICKYICDDFFFFQFVQSLIFWCSFYHALKILEIRKIYFLLLFYLQFYFNLPMAMFRECLAVSFFFISLKYLLNDRLINYYICITIAFFFHVSAIVLFILPLLKYICKFKAKVLLFIVLLMPFFIPFSLGLMNSFLLSLGIDSILSYSERYYHNDAMLFSFSLTNYAKNILLFILLYYLVRKKIGNDDYLIYGAFILYLAFDMIAAMQIEMFFRFANYFFVFYYCVINRTLSFNMYKRSLRVFVFLIILYQPINVHIGIFSNTYSNLLCPYASYFWGDKKHYDKEKPETVPDYILW